MSGSTPKAAAKASSSRPATPGSLAQVRPKCRSALPRRPTAMAEPPDDRANRSTVRAGGQGVRAGNLCGLTRGRGGWWPTTERATRSGRWQTLLMEKAPPRDESVNDIVSEIRASAAAARGQRPRRKWWLVTALGAGLLVAAAAVSSWMTGQDRSPALYEDDGKGTSLMRFSNPGEPHFFGLIELRPLGRHPVRLLRAEMIGVPDGVVIDRVAAVRLSQVGNFPGALRGAGQAARLRPLYHALDEVVVDPRCPPEARCQPRTETGSPPVQDWILLLECHITRPGDFEIPGFRVTYEVRGKRQTQSFLNHRVALHSGERPG